MKHFMYLVVTATALLISCSQKDSEEISSVMPTEDFTATFANNTRTELNGNAVVWNEDDQLTIFTKTSHNRKYQIKELSDDGRTATFGYVSYTGNNSAAITSNYAVYPYDAEATLSGDVITTKINAEQVYDANKVDLSNALMVAKSDTNSFVFKNSGALMCFKLSKDNVPEEYTLQSIKLTSASNKIAGEITIDTAQESKAVVTENGTNEILLNNINVDLTNEEQLFYIALPAMEFEDKDLTVTFTFVDGEQAFVLPAFNLVQGNIKCVRYNIKSEDFIGDVSINEYVETFSGIDDSKLDYNKYLTYVANSSQQLDYSSEVYRYWDTYFEHNIDDVMIAEYKFQLAPTNYNQQYISDDYIYIHGNILYVFDHSYKDNYDETDYAYNRIDLTAIGIQPTDLIVLRLDKVNNVVTINDQEVSVNKIGVAMSSRYVFSCYYSESDEGHLYRYKGMTNGAKLYYAKGWNNDGYLTYLGYASTDTNTQTGNVEACWRAKYFNGEIVEKITFANNRYVENYAPLGMGNM